MTLQDLLWINRGRDGGFLAPALIMREERARGLFISRPLPREETRTVNLRYGRSRLCIERDCSGQEIFCTVMRRRRVRERSRRLEIDSHDHDQKGVQGSNSVLNAVKNLPLYELRGVLREATLTSKHSLWTKSSDAQSVLNISWFKPALITELISRDLMRLCARSSKQLKPDMVERASRYILLM